MKKLFCFFLTLFFQYCLSQNLNGTVNVTYKLINNTDQPNALNATLFIRGTTTIYNPKYSTRVNNYKLSKREKPVDVNDKSLDLYFIKIDHAKKEIFSFEDIGRTKVIVQDDYILLQWDIAGETKVIAGYQCQKATTSYRGREWVAWFAPEIALPYGPWKLHGLPGLILETYETTNTYIWKIENIEYKEDAVFEKEFSTLVETKNKKPIPLKQYLKDKDEYYSNAQNEMKQQFPGAVFTTNSVRSGYELKYEWEP